MAWADINPAEYSQYGTDVGDAWGTSWSPSAQYAPYFQREMRTDWNYGDPQTGFVWQHDADAMNTAQSAAAQRGWQTGWSAPMSESDFNAGYQSNLADYTSKGWTPDSSGAAYEKYLLSQGSGGLTDLQRQIERNWSGLSETGQKSMYDLAQTDPVTAAWAQTGLVGEYQGLKQFGEYAKGNIGSGSGWLQNLSTQDRGALQESWDSAKYLADADASENKGKWTRNILEPMFLAAAAMLTGGALAPALTAVGAGAVAGGATGAMGAGMRGGDIGKGALMGAATGAAGGALAPMGAGISETLGGGVLGDMGGKAVTGGLLGAGKAALTGGDIGQAGLSGALGGATGAAGNALGSSIGDAWNTANGGDQSWGVNPQTGSGGLMDENGGVDWNMSDDDYWAAGQNGSDYTLPSDIPQGFGMEAGPGGGDTMWGTGDPLADPSSSGINWGGLGSTALKGLLGLFGGGGGGGTATGGTGGSRPGSPSGTDRSGGAGGDMTNFGGLFGGIYDYNTLDRSSDFLKQIMDQTGQYGDPYKQYRPQEAAMRNQTFTDPLSIYNSEPYQLLDKRMQDQQLAKDSQAGQLFNAPERLAQRQTGFLDHLSKLRADLLPGSGAGLNPIAPQAAQAEMMKSYVPLEMRKAQAVGQATNAGMNAMQPTLQQIMEMIGSMGGGGI